jgi:hypothetical protein
MTLLSITSFGFGFVEYQQHCIQVLAFLLAALFALFMFMFMFMFMWQWG